MYSQKYLIRKSVMATLSAALFLGSTAFASGMALAATKPFPLPPMLHFTPIAPNTPVVQVTPMAKWNPEDMLDPDSKGGPAWGGLFDVEALGMSQNNPTSPQPSCPSGWGGSYNWPTKAQSIQWWESQPNNQALSNIQKYTYGTKQHFEWIVGTEYSHQDEMGWQDDCVPPPPPPPPSQTSGSTSSTKKSSCAKVNGVEVCEKGKHEYKVTWCTIAAAVCPAGDWRTKTVNTTNDGGNIGNYGMTNLSDTTSVSIHNGNVTVSSSINPNTPNVDTGSNLPAGFSESDNLNTGQASISGSGNIQNYESEINAECNGSGYSSSYCQNLDNAVSENNGLGSNGNGTGGSPGSGF